MNRLHKMMFFILAILPSGFARIKTAITGAKPEKADHSDEVLIAKLIYKNSKLKTKAASDFYESKEKIKLILLSYCQIKLLLATSLHLAIKHNLSSKSNLLVHKSILSTIERLNAFYYAFLVATNFNETLTDVCYKKLQSKKEVSMVESLSNNDSFIIRK